MNRLSIEPFIKKLTFRQISAKRTFGTLLITFAVIVLMGGAAVKAQAPTSHELQAQHAKAREQALAIIASELKQIVYDREQILWLARVLYSETKLAHEMPYIGWVVRNRVELGHRAFDYEAGVNNYKGASLARSQFSGLHPRLDRNAVHNLSMDYGMVGNPAWDNALDIAESIYYSDGSDRVLSQRVVYFYSPTVISPPNWASSSREAHRFPSNRFAFYYQ